jgi:hypothetical protein
VVMRSSTPGAFGCELNRVECCSHAVPFPLTQTIAAVLCQRAISARSDCIGNGDPLRATAAFVIATVIALFLHLEQPPASSFVGIGTGGLCLASAVLIDTLKNQGQRTVADRDHRPAGVGSKKV